MSSSRLKILLVDDEPSILAGLSRGLRQAFDVRTATSGDEGLQLLAAELDIAIVMSDMRMPVMNGSAFLAKARTIAPDAVRLLLTGQADIDDAISAINEGSIFRFLQKPCSPEVMLPALEAAAAQHRLITAERTLLEQTLRGSLQALTDALALANPGVFGMSTRVKRCASTLASKLGLTDVWQIEVAAMVCQLGAMTLPAEVFERKARGETLLPHEREMLARVPAITEQLLAPIPRLEPVREIIRHGRANFTAAEDPILRAGHILRVALDFEELESSDHSPARAIERMQARTGAYDPDVLRALAGMYARESAARDVSIGALRVGMIIASDVLTKNGQLLIARGHQVTPGLVGRLENFAGSLASATVSIESDAA